jgi:hypothetical protein
MMGRSVDLTQPLSDEDRAWLLERGAYGDLRIADEVARASAAPEPVAAEEIPVQPEAAPDDDDNSVVDSAVYGEWTNAQLRYELSTRELPQYGTKAELIARLEESDASGSASGDGGA